MMRGKERKKDQMEGKGLLLIAFTGTGMRTFLSASSTSTGKSFTYRQCSARQYLRKVPHLIPFPSIPRLHLTCPYLNCNELSSDWAG
jgi:hypothetical protein